MNEYRMEEVQEGESDRVARKRIAFQRAHKDTIPDIDLLGAYASVYANIATLGCVYPPEVMRRISVLTADVQEDAVDAPEMRSLVLASRGRAHAKKIRNENEESRNERPPPRSIPTVGDKLTQMKEQLMCAHRDASGVSMFEGAVRRLQMRWQMTEVNGQTHIVVGGITALSHTFGDKKHVKEQSVNAVVDAFLEGGPVTIEDTMIFFNGRSPSNTYSDSVSRNIRKAATFLGVNDTVTKILLEEALDKANLAFTVDTKHLQGWQQIVQLRSGDLLLMERILKKGDCAKPKMEAAVTEMCAQLGESLRKGNFKIEVAENGGLAFTCLY